MLQVNDCLYRNFLRDNSETAQLASEHSHVFEKLLCAYAQIAEVLPVFDRLQNTFQDDANFRIALGLVYADILYFHHQAYKFLRKGGQLSLLYILQGGYVYVARFLQEVPLYLKVYFLPG